MLDFGSFYEKKERDYGLSWFLNIWLNNYHGALLLS